MSPLGPVPDRPVAILGGTGQLGLGLALRLARAGVPVAIGSRDAARAREVADRVAGLVPGAEVRGDDAPRATAGAEFVVLAVPYAASAATVKSIASQLTPDQIVIDATVPLAPAVGGRPTHLLGVWQGSAAEQTRSLVPTGVSVTSALHTVGAAGLADLETPLDQDTLVCGDDSASKARVIALLGHVGGGLRPIDAGRLEMSRIAEALTPLLIGVNIRNKAHAGIRLTSI